MKCDEAAQSSLFVPPRVAAMYHSFSPRGERDEGELDTGAAMWSPICRKAVEPTILVNGKRVNIPGRRDYDEGILVPPRRGQRTQATKRWKTPLPNFRCEVRVLLE
jgi:hypothetical protein